MLHVENFTMTHQQDLKVLIPSLSFDLKPGDKLALIGEEGCGKSSLLNWLRQPDAPLPYVEVTGTCSNSFGRTVWIGQTFPAQDEGLTIEAYCFDPVLAEQIDYGYFYQLVSQLGFDPDRLTSQQLMGTLSGGEKLKLQLARTLALEPDCLLLDEPSNDLDLVTLDWLSRTLASLPAAVLFISHDEAFLAQVANRILHIETIHNHKASRVHLVNLDYETYRSQREAQFQRQGQLARKQQEEQAKQEARHRQMHDKVQHQLRQAHDSSLGRLLAKKMRNVKSLGRRLERQAEDMLEIPIQEDAILVKLPCPHPLPASKWLINEPDYVVRLEGRALTQPLTLEWRGQEKIGLVGPNGVGKSTLLKQVRDWLTDRPGIRLGYMPQDYRQVLPQNQTPLDFLQESGSQEEKTKLMTYLGSLRFDPDEMRHPISQLSGGQQAKLLLLKLNLMEVNVLLLDEPSRNFSPLSQAEVRQIFRDFPGAILAVSHDQLFLDQVCDRRLALEAAEKQ